jgi:CTP:molybdopterin cytidylyltransferase MocA
VIMDPAGVLLAAGAGASIGRPKALVRDAAGVPWVVRSGRVGSGDAVLSRAGYEGRAGHPVLMGRAHWEAAAAAARGDRGAGSYLKRAGCPLIPCDDLTL